MCALERVDPRPLLRATSPPQMASLALGGPDSQPEQALLVRIRYQAPDEVLSMHNLIENFPSDLGGNCD